ncbi:GGDEF domain [Photobacterium aphoticum]|uniref:GGDEF domain n=1 Tax=Photobacterium aphoticum TaxID=754436 RepID=A0A090R294_9GAMM|nr:GGDEF domain [Photobacterium aphoticum]
MAVLTNLSRKLDHDWIQEHLAQAALHTDHIKWLPVLLSAEQAIHRWYARENAQALMELESLMTTVIRDQYEFLLPKLLYWSGYMALSNNEVLQAQKYLLKSTYYAEQYNNVFYQSKIYHGLSLTYILMDEWEQALVAIQKARTLGELWPNVDDNTLQLYWYNESTILSKMQRKQEAKAAYLKAHTHYLLDNQSLRFRILDIRGAANIAMLDGDDVLAIA